MLCEEDETGRAAAPTALVNTIFRSLTGWEKKSALAVEQLVAVVLLPATTRMVPQQKTNSVRPCQNYVRHKKFLNRHRGRLNTTNADGPCATRSFYNFANRSQDWRSERVYLHPKPISPKNNCNFEENLRPRSFLRFGNNGTLNSGTHIGVSLLRFGKTRAHWKTELGNCSTLGGPNRTPTARKWW